MSLQTTITPNRVRYAPTNETKALERLEHMLTFKRPAGSQAEKQFIREFITPLSPACDQAGNRHIVIGESAVIWCAHTDTVHREPGRQSITRLGNLIQLPKHEKANCLGADCTTGVWLMLEMIRAKVPGRYVFFRGEECGGIGSNWLAANRADMLARYTYAIALDRRGDDEIITHQFGQRCASEAFAQSLATQLPHGYKASDAGTFTDTANLTEVIGECTNIAVGYEAQHTSRETQNVAVALELRDALLAFDESALVAQRKPGEVDPLDYRARHWTSKHALDRFVDYRDEWRATDYRDQWSGAASTADAQDYNGRGPRDVRSFVETYPALVGAILEEYGFDIDELNRIHQEYYS